MTAVAQEANRPWDGRRLLRFLTGLAMLALAVTLQLPAVPVPAAAPVPVAATVPAAVSATAAVEREQPRAVPAPPPAPVDALVVPAPVPAPVVLTGIVPVTGDPRGPPTR